MGVRTRIGGGGHSLAVAVFAAAVLAFPAGAGASWVS